MAATAPFLGQTKLTRPNISAQQELLIPADAISIQSIDPIITGPRAYKPRADVERAGSKDS